MNVIMILRESFIYIKNNALTHTCTNEYTRLICISNLTCDHMLFLSNMDTVNLILLFTIKIFLQN